MMNKKKYYAMICSEHTKVVKSKQAKSNAKITLTTFFFEKSLARTGSFKNEQETKRFETKMIFFCQITTLAFHQPIHASALGLRTYFLWL